MTNLARITGNGFVAILEYQDKKLHIVIGAHACEGKKHLGRVVGDPDGSSLFECTQCGQGASFEEMFEYLPTPGYYQESRYHVEHMCTQCDQPLYLEEIMDAEHNLCQKHKTKERKAKGGKR